MSLLIFAEAPSPRLHYTADLLFRQLSGIAFRITNDHSEFERYEGPRLNYSLLPSKGNALWIAPHGLLTERGIQPQACQFFMDGENPAFFPTPGAGAHFSFDVFSAVFFLVSRYEEYLPAQRDAHDRFPATSSLAFQNGFLHRPVVNEWSKQLSNGLQKWHPALAVKTMPYQFQPTYDIDIAWAYGHRPWWQTLGAVVLEMAKGKRAILQSRMKVMRKQEVDPYFTFAWLEQLHQQWALHPLFFWLLGDYGRFDRNISPKSPALRQLIVQLAEKYPVGIHPSYAASENYERLEMEIGRLRQISGQPVVRSRQHYLRLRFPDTYRQLIGAGIQEDYSLGYADQPGFRAGIASPFYWYDLEGEASTDLLLHPFQVMDVTLQQYLGLDPETAIAATKRLSDAVRTTGGAFTTLWHNSSFSSLHGWAKWAAAYETILQNSR